MSPYQTHIGEFARWLEQGKALPLGNVSPLQNLALPHDAPKALVFSPHPDDECIIGGLPLRLMREAGMRVANVAVTLGSKPERRSERLAEARGACAFLGFDLIETAPRGLEDVHLAAREKNPGQWAASVEVIAQILLRYRPSVIFFPHQDDWNSTHIGTHFLVMEALERLTTPLDCLVVETEFWGQMSRPNLLVESSEEQLAALAAALSFHVGEVMRNPYHALLPVWMADNVRRGSERVQGQGAAAAGFKFATLYRVRRWMDGQMQDAITGGRVFSCGESVKELVP